MITTHEDHEPNDILLEGEKSRFVVEKSFKIFRENTVDYFNLITS